MFLTSRDTTETKLSLPGLSRPFRDGWQLCIGEANLISYSHFWSISRISITSMSRAYSIMRLHLIFREPGLFYPFSMLLSIFGKMMGDYFWFTLVCLPTNNTILSSHSTKSTVNSLHTYPPFLRLFHCIDVVRTWTNMSSILVLHYQLTIRVNSIVAMNKKFKSQLHS